MDTDILHRTAVVLGRTIYYREAGDPVAPTILLLHGLAESGETFETLMPALADQFHLVAPDHLGFGRSEAPPTSEFGYSYETLAEHVIGLAEALQLRPLILYMHACGGPMGFRLFARHPDRVEGLIIQNANAYVEGVGAACTRALAPLWGTRNAETEQAACDFAIPPADARRELPLTKQGLADLLESYQTNMALYPEWQAAFREHQPATLIIWSKHDQVFIPPGARAYLEDLPNAKLVWLDAGHAVPAEKWARVAAEIKAMFAAPPLRSVSPASQRARRLQAEGLSPVRTISS